MISSIKSNIHSLAYIQQNDKTVKGQKLVREEIVQALKILKNIKNLYNGSKIDHLNIWHEISLAFWDPYEDDWEIKNIDEAKKLKDEIWSNGNYLLFKAILRPGYKFSDNIPEIAKGVKEENIELLEDIIKFAENEKSIYNSIKTFFYYLGSNKVIEKIIEKALADEKSYLWYYIGFAFSKVKDAIVFGKTVKPDSIVKIKSTIDAFYHVGYLPGKDEKEINDWEKQPDKTKKEIYSFLLKQIKLGTGLIKKDQSEIFWWSSSTSASTKAIFEDNNTADSLKLFEEILDDFSEKEEYSNYLFNAVADSLWLLKKQDISKSPASIAELRRILDKFVNSGPSSQSTEAFFNSIAKVDILLLLDFYLKRLNADLDISFHDRIPFTHDFVFSDIKKDISKKEIDEVLEKITSFNNEKVKKFGYRNISRIFVDFGKNTDINYAIGWFKDNYLKKNKNNYSAINAVSLLQDYDDYSNEIFWDFLEWVMTTFDSKKVRSAIWGTYISGSIDLERIKQKEKALNKWLKSNNKNVKLFAMNELKRLQQERKEWQ
ncbi:MAG: hypothetical protein PHC38_11280 [Weeksellaceae bacterium]|nr:hypothetical protein [Weeksellaceae bacterium]